MDDNTRTEKFGVHLMFDGYNGNKDLLRDIRHLTKLLFEIPKKMEMEIISEPKVVEIGPQNDKDLGGISGFVMIAESHISYHTFPEDGFVTADIYTCQNNLDVERFIKLLSEAFGTSDFDVQVIDRGLRFRQE